MSNKNGKKKIGDFSKKVWYQMNQQERARYAEKVKKDHEKYKITNAALRDALRVTGGLDRINELLSSAWLFQSIGNQFVEESNELLAQYGMKGGSLNVMYKKAQRSNDDYFKAFFQLVQENDNEETLRKIKADLLTDLIKLEDAFYEAFPDKEREWQPDLSKEELIREIEEKYHVTIKRNNDGEEEG